MQRRTRRDGDGSRVICDFHVHSRYSRATSERMTVESIDHYAQLKGLNVVGSGDFTHPGWMRELKQSLSAIPEADLYQLKSVSPHIYFIITGEVNTIFEVAGKIRKIHHLLLTPSFDTAEQISDRLRAYGNLASDGRPTLHISASELVEEVMAVSRANAVIPAHVWTPWYSLFGSINGFERIEDCYEDATKHIFALETGLSSDPPMNWRLSVLDRFALVSNSDAHSPYPYRLGREANVFQVEELSYGTLLDILHRKDAKRFQFTIETNPAYGKYHWTGHRNCNVSMPPSQSQQLGGRCPVCRRPLTKGVDERVAGLADRPPGFKPPDAVEYVHLLPLHEILSAALGVQSVYASSVWQQFNALVAALGNEYAIVLDTPLEVLEEAVEPRIAETIIQVRKGEITVVPGYDGVYGEVKLFEDKPPTRSPYGRQNSLDSFV